VVLSPQPGGGGDGAGGALGRAADRVGRGAGVNTLTWAGRGAQGRPAPDGVYRPRVVATTEEGESVPAVRTVRVGW